MQFRVQGASVIGRNHTRLARNNQDCVRVGEVSGNGRLYQFGVICDGCSAGTSNEVGANLLSTYLASEIPMVLSIGIALEDLPEALFMRCIGYLRSVAAQTVVGTPQATVQFVRDHLLCTVMGFVLDGEDCVVFWVGDGAIYYNGQLKRIDQDNHPLYIGYHLVDRSFLKLQNAELPHSFEVFTAKAADIQRLAICSDGVIPEVTEQVWGIGTARQLGWALKGLVRGNVTMQDDCSVITIERLEEEAAEATPAAADGEAT